MKKNQKNSDIFDSTLINTYGTGIRLFTDSRLSDVENREVSAFLYKTEHSMLTIKVDDINDGFNVGNNTPWDAAIDSIKNYGGVIIKALTGEGILIKSEAELKKFFNVQ